MKKLIFFLAAFFSLSFAFAVDASQLLPPEQAFVPQVKADKQGVTVEFKIADGYYLYRDKITVAAGAANRVRRHAIRARQRKGRRIFRQANRVLPRRPSGFPL